MSGSCLNPPDPKPVICPACEGECEIIYKDCDGNVLACDQCIITQDACEWDTERLAELAENES